MASASSAHRPRSVFQTLLLPNLQCTSSTFTATRSDLGEMSLPNQGCIVVVYTDILMAFNLSASLFPCVYRLQATQSVDRHLLRLLRHLAQLSSMPNLMASLVWPSTPSLCDRSRPSSPTFLNKARFPSQCFPFIWTGECLQGSEGESVCESSVTWKWTCSLACLKSLLCLLLTCAAVIPTVATAVSSSWVALTLLTTLEASTTCPSAAQHTGCSPCPGKLNVEHGWHMFLSFLAISNWLFSALLSSVLSFPHLMTQGASANEMLEHSVTSTSITYSETVCCPGLFCLCAVHAHGNDKQLGWLCTLSDAFFFWRVRFFLVCQYLVHPPRPAPGVAKLLLTLALLSWLVPSTR